VTRPNILFLMTDEQRWDCVGYMDPPVSLTPNLDRLAAAGVTFPRCYSPNPVCMPARCSIHTGLYACQTGQMDNRGDWPMETPTFTQALQKLGYHTALTGKIHAHEGVGEAPDQTGPPWIDELHGLGFDDVCQAAGKGMAFLAEDHYTYYLHERGLLDAMREDMVLRNEGKRPGSGPTPLPDEDFIDSFIGRRAIEWQENYADEKPFFHMVSFCGPHPPFDVYQSARDRVPLDKVPLPVEGPDLPDGYDPEAWRRSRASYLANICIIDDNMGRLFEAMQRKGQLDNTLVVFTSDHGTMLGDLGKYAKCHWEDPSVRVPLMVYYRPWQHLARRADQTMVSSHDVAATMIDFAAGKACASEYLPGCSSRSLLPFVEGKTDRVRDVVYSEQGQQFVAPWRMVDNGQYKYVYLLDDDKDLLFDMREDPHCLNDVASDPAYATALNDMKGEMLRILIEHPTPKTGKAARSLNVPHAINRDFLRPFLGKHV